jgi:CHAT domain-containing protein
MSLWSIPDSDTIAIMADFYRSLRAGARTEQVLRDAVLSRLWARRQLTGAAIPFFWGAFIAFGSPG